MRISDWSSDVCSSDLPAQVHDIGQSSHGVRAAAEAEQADPVAGMIMADDRSIAVDDVLIEACAERRLEDLPDICRRQRSAFAAPKPGIVDRKSTRLNSSH